MFTSTVGDTFIKAYNKTNGTSYIARKFFNEIFVPLFFDYNKYMMTAGNSPLENPKISWNKMLNDDKPFESEETRKQRIKKMEEKILNDPIDASIAMGYSTNDRTTGTSGQVTSIEINHTKDDIYLSWIGAALSVGVKGGLLILFNEPEILLDIYAGWKHYRYYLEHYKKLRGNQINTWNGHWISHVYDERKYDENNPLFGFAEPGVATTGIMEFPTVSWVNILSKIAKKKSVDNYLGYIYKIAQTNTTIGFIPFRLPQIRKPYDLYKKIFGTNYYLRHEDKINKLFGSKIGFQYACQKGSIGIEALEPKGLEIYMTGYNKRTKMPILHHDNEEEVITFNTYKIWVLAMLNNEELWERSREIAKLLENFESGAGKGRTDRRNNVEKFLNSYSKNTVIENLIPIVDESKNSQSIVELAKIVNDMSDDNVKRLILLIRFNYADISRK